MSKATTNTVVKRIVDAVMTVLLLFVMAYQVTGDMAHEWIGVGMTACVIIHQLLNRRWYGALFKGKHNPYRIVTTILNTLLLLSFALTAFCGMSMSGYAVPFLYGDYSRANRHPLQEPSVHRSNVSGPPFHAIGPP